MSETTKGASFNTEDRDENFTPVEQTDSASGSSTQSSRMMFDIKEIPQVMGQLEARFPFTATVIALIGYIIIASFSGIQTLGQYIGYVGFLMIVYFFYYITTTSLKKELLRNILFLIIVLETCLIAYVFRSDIQALLRVDISINETSTATSLISTSSNINQE